MVRSEGLRTRLALTINLPVETAFIDGSDKKYKHPAAALERDAWTAALRFSQELGFSPASRSRVSGALTLSVPKVRPTYHGHADFPVDAG